MTSRSILLLSLPLLGLAGCATAPAGAEADQYGHTTVITGDFPTLEEGMTIEAIQGKLGAPVEIQPVATPDGKAEVWVYHLEKSQGMEQIEVGTKEVSAFTMGLPGTELGTAREPVYSLAEKRAFVTLKLLIFNGRLVAQKAKVESRTTRID